MIVVILEIQGEIANIQKHIGNCQVSSVCDDPTGTLVLPEIGDLGFLSFLTLLPDAICDWFWHSSEVAFLLEKVIVCSKTSSLIFSFSKNSGNDISIFKVNFTSIGEKQILKAVTLKNFPFS